MTKNRIIAAFVCIALMLSCLIHAAPVHAQSSQATETEKVIDGIMSFNLTESGSADVQQWIDSSLARNAGISSETYILALHQSGKVYDYSEYSRGLLQYLDENSIANAVTRQKYALSLMAANCRSEYISSASEETIGELGVMSWVFGLHLLNNGCTGSYTADEVISALLDLRLADGGWAVRGDSSDADVTAMVIQSLAPYYSRDDVHKAVDDALAFLSGIQSASGTFSSYGTENAESTAQVIIALSALGFDCREDARFVKNGISPLDGLMRFRLTDGSFAHEQGGTYSLMATTQALCSLTSIRRMESGLGSLYMLDPQPDNTVTYENTDESPADGTIRNSYKPLAAGAVILLTGAVCLVLFILKKHNSKNILAAGVCAAAALLFIFCTDIQCASDYYGGEDVQKSNIIGTVSMTIRCDTIADRDAEHIPDDGVILALTEFSLSEGETAYDILTEAARKHSIHLDASGSTGTSLGTEYVSGINYTYEFDYGDLSGWVYLVNGEFPSVGCGSYVLSDGDIIEWHYSLDMGSDI